MYFSFYFKRGSVLNSFKDKLKFIWFFAEWFKKIFNRLLINLLGVKSNHVLGKKNKSSKKAYRSLSRKFLYNSKKFLSF